MNKTCRVCNRELLLKDFNKKKKNKDGLQDYCRRCSNERSKKYYNLNKKHHIEAVQIIRGSYIKRNRKLVEIVKLQYGCAKCDESDPCCIDFHHLSNKAAYVSKLVGGGSAVDTLVKEISKCICVCANCHRKIHAGKLSAVGLSPVSTIALQEIVETVC